MGRKTGSLEVDRARARQVTLMLAGVLSLSEEDILNGQSREACTARRIAYSITRNAFAMSLARVAIAFGRDRSSIAHACRRLEDQRDDLAFDYWMTALENSAAVAPAPFISARRNRKHHLEGLNEQ
jgi:hypothetical protein